MSTPSEQLAELAMADVDLAERIDALSQERAKIRTKILELTPGPDTYAAGSLTVVRTVNRRFDAKKALTQIPVGRLAEVTTPSVEVDRDRLRVLMPDIYEAAWTAYDDRLVIR